MPLLGAHMSISGGLDLAFSRILEIGGEALQIYTRNQRQWRCPALTEEAALRFRERREESGSMPVAAHDAYLINLASADTVTLRQSVSAFADELRRASRLSIPFLIAHPGSHLGTGTSAGIKRFVNHLDRAITLAEIQDVTVLLEITAGQGTNLGSSFEEIGSMITLSHFGRLLGVCFDTCHAFAAGYDIRTPETYSATLESFDLAIGLDRIRFFHLNDSKLPLGSRVDRHEHIGKGKIGLECFRLLLNDSRFQSHPMVLETPKGKDLRSDRENLKVLRSLLNSTSQEICLRSRSMGRRKNLQST
ncbi:MAG: deoxyribonuclease IV [Deltaproteobacteria bacterium HGW-Deltaproteobacteria-21]|nr:MAG: deoxyribonuclease IV [Deltaproteobacteria bacterium HGW-Deltaproteobacteria-21]